MVFVTLTLSLLSDAGKTLLELRPPELQFVLAGPFTDSQILTYRLSSILVAVLPITIVAPLVLSSYMNNFLGAFAGVGLVTLFVFLLTFLHALATPSLSSGARQAIRLVMLIGSLSIPVELLSRLDVSGAIKFETVVAALGETRSLQIAGAVFRPFTNLMFEPLGPMTLVWCGTATALVSLTVVGCYRFNGGFAEMAVDGIARRTKRLQRAKTDNFAGLPSGKVQFRRSVPSPAWLSGFGPVAWIQLTILMRRFGRSTLVLLGVGIITAIGIGIFFAYSTNPVEESLRTAIVPMALLIASYLSFLIGMQSSLGFALDTRALTNFSVLPLRPFPTAVGMLTGLVTLQLVLQLAVFLPACVVSNLSWPANAALFLAGFTLNLAITSIINLICVWTELRPMGSTTPDIFQGMRAIVFVLLVFVGLIPSLAIGSAGAGILGLVFGFGWTQCAVGAALGIASVQPLAWWLTATRWASHEA